MRYATTKNSFKFKLLFFLNPPLLKLTVFVLNFQNQLVGLVLFNANWAYCGEFLSAGPVSITFNFEVFSSRSKHNYFLVFNFLCLFYLPQHINLPMN